jgi:hypothetical protein
VIRIRAVFVMGAAWVTIKQQLEMVKVARGALFRLDNNTFRGAHTALSLRGVGDGGSSPP